MKKLFFLPALALALCLMAPLASATPDIPAVSSAEQAAEALYQLGLFRGTGVNPDGTPIFDLDRVPSRNQAAIMLIRLLGKEEEALAGTWETPFTDVVPGSVPAPYVGYAYAHGLTKGTTETTYSGVKPVTRNQYLLFLMRVLGYDYYQPSLSMGFPYEDGESMTTDQAADAAAMLGLTGDISGADFLRGEVALLSWRALDTFLCGRVNSSEPLKTLRESLGLGASPRFVNKAVPVEVEQYGSYEEADARIQRDAGGICRVLDEIPIPGGTLLSYEWAGIPHGPLNRVWAVYQDGTVLSLPLPRLNMAQYPQAVNLSYDKETGTATYEADIPNDLTGYFGITQFRRAGTYHYACDLNRRTATVTETALVRREENAEDTQEKISFTEKGYPIWYSSVEEAKADILNRATRVVREIPVYNGTFYHYVFLNHDAYNREVVETYLRVIRDDGTCLALPFSRNTHLPGFDDLTLEMTVEDVRYDAATREVLYEVSCKTERTEARTFLYAFDLETLTATVTEQ